MSAASARKRVAGQVAKGSQKTGWYADSFGGWQAPAELEIGSWEARWERYLLEHPDTPYALARRAIPGIVEPAGDVHAIGAASDRYIGLIYADGNQVGRHIDSSPSPGMFRERSRTMHGAARAAAFAALSRHLAPHHGTHPFEIIAIGGDDLLLIVPGNRAFDIALSTAHGFAGQLGAALRRTSSERYLGPETPPPGDVSRYQPPVGLSAGVVIAQETAPIFFLRDLLQELLDNAKRRAAALPGQGELSGTVDFMVLKSITMVTNQIRGFRAAALERGDRRLTARPYTWHEFGGLLATIRALKGAGLPRSQLYRLGEVLADQPSVAASTLEYLYTRARLGRAHGDALKTHVEQHWQAPPGTPPGPGAPPWLRLPGGGWETIWGDLVEAYAMVEP
jgi:CRISPR-associated protein Cmr2